MEIRLFRKKLRIYTYAGCTTLFLGTLALPSLVKPSDALPTATAESLSIEPFQIKLGTNTSTPLNAFQAATFDANELTQADIEIYQEHAAQAKIKEEKQIAVKRKRKERKEYLSLLTRERFLTEEDRQRFYEMQAKELELRKEQIEKIKASLNLTGFDQATIQQKIKAILQLGYALKGTRYKRGGMSSTGIDCSGFVKSCFDAIGHRIPRTSAEQAVTVGEKVEKNQIQAGDLLFFSQNGRRISHVAMVAEVSNGDVKFIHSSSSKGVCEDYLSSKYYRTRFMYARRPFN